MLKGDDLTMDAFEEGTTPSLMANPGFNVEFVMKIAKQLYDLYTASQSGGDHMKSIGTSLFSSAIGGGYGGSKGDEEEEDDDPVKKFGGFAKSFW